MSDTRRQPSLKTLGALSALAACFSWLTLWLVESWIAYLFFVYEIALIVVIFLVISNYDTLFSIGAWPTGSLWRVADMLLFAAPLTLLIMNIYSFPVEPIRALLGLISTSVLPGYALLRIVGVNKHFSKLESFILAYVISYVYTGFAWLVLLSVDASIRGSLLLCSYVIIGAIAVSRRRRRAETESRPDSFCKDIDKWALLLALGFYVISFGLIYPGFALLPGTDASYHYGVALVLGRTPDLYIDFSYLMAHLHESAFIYASNLSLLSSQIALVSLNLTLPIAFYVASKRFLGHIDNRLPILSTLFWSLFTNSFGGFTWISFIEDKIQSFSQSQAQLLVETADRTYNGTVYGILGLWYVPVTVAFVMLLTLFSLIPNRRLPRRHFYLLFTVIFSGMFLTHVAEAMVFGLFLAFVGLVSRNRELRVRESIASSAVGLVIVIVVYGVLSGILIRFLFSAITLLSVLVPETALCLSWVFRQRRGLGSRELTEASVVAGRSKKLHLGVLAVLAVVYLYLISLFCELFLIDDFHTYQVDSVGLVPFFLYPLMLGVNGLLGLAAMYFLLKQKRCARAYAFFLAFLAFTLVAGRIVSLLNLNYLQTGYWEKRFIWFIKIPLALLAPVFLLSVAKVLRQKPNRTVVRTALVTSLVGIIVVSGMSTTFLNVEYWYGVAGIPGNLQSAGQVELEMEGLTYLGRIIADDPRSWVCSVSGTSAGFTTFSGPADRLGLTQLLYTATRPEMAFTQLYRHPAYTHPYIYIASRDSRLLLKQNNSFLAKYLDAIPTVFQNPIVTIYNSTKPSFPQENSDLFLVLPFDNFLVPDQCFTGYYLLSGGFYNYSVAYDFDDSILGSKILVLDYDPPQENNTRQEYETDFDGRLGDWQNLNGSWSLDQGLLVAGDDATPTEGLILAPLVWHQFNASFVGKPTKFHEGVSNYVGLVYSFQDYTHFKLAQIHFNSTGHMYVLTYSVNGTSWSYGETDPMWPGQDAGIQWSPGDSYNFGMNVGTNSTSILVNGSEVVSVSTADSDGRVGLFYSGFDLISFDEFKVYGNKTLQSRSCSDYIRFMESGGKIVVLNTNGYSYFGTQLLSFTNSSVISSLIEGAGVQVSLGTGIPVQTVYPKNGSIYATANYTSFGGQSSYIVEKKIGLGSLVYVNLYPVLQAFDSHIVSIPRFLILSRMLDFLSLPKMREQVVQTVGYVRRISLEGLNVTTASILLPLRTGVYEVKAQVGATEYDFENVTEMRLRSGSVFFVAAEASTENGEGPYSVFEVNSSFLLRSPTIDMGLEIRTKLGNYTLNSVELLTITPGEGGLTLLVRAPKIDADRVILREFFSLGDLNLKTSCWGRDLEISGGVTVNIGISDTYTLIKEVEMRGEWVLIPPLAQYDELSKLPMIFFWSVVLLPVMLCIALIIIVGKRVAKRAHIPSGKT